MHLAEATPCGHVDLSGTWYSVSAQKYFVLQQNGCESTTLRTLNGRGSVNMAIYTDQGATENPVPTSFFTNWLHRFTATHAPIDEATVTASYNDSQSRVTLNVRARSNGSSGEPSSGAASRATERATFVGVGTVSVSEGLVPEGLDKTRSCQFPPGAENSLNVAIGTQLNVTLRCSEESGSELEATLNDIRGFYPSLHRMRGQSYSDILYKVESTGAHRALVHCVTNTEARRFQRGSHDPVMAK